MANITWSYSSLSLYQQCPKKYYHLKVAKDIKEPLGEAIVFGNTIHKIAEEYVGKGVPIPAQYKEIEPALLAGSSTRRCGGVVSLTSSSCRVIVH
jgi:hypothetical protein